MNQPKTTAIEFAHGSRLILAVCHDGRPPDDATHDRTSRARLWVRVSDGTAWHPVLRTTDFDEAVRVALACDSVVVAVERLRAPKPVQEVVP